MYFLSPLSPVRKRIYLCVINVISILFYYRKYVLHWFRSYLCDNTNTLCCVLGVVNLQIETCL